MHCGWMQCRIPGRRFRRVRLCVHTQYPERVRVATYGEESDPLPTQGGYDHVCLSSESIVCIFASSLFYSRTNLGSVVGQSLTSPHRWIASSFPCFSSSRGEEGCPCRYLALAPFATPETAAIFRVEEWRW